MSLQPRHASEIPDPQLRRSLHFLQVIHSLCGLTEGAGLHRDGQWWELARCLWRGRGGWARSLPGEWRLISLEEYKSRFQHSVLRVLRNWNFHQFLWNNKASFGPRDEMENFKKKCKDIRWVRFWNWVPTGRWRSAARSPRFGELGSRTSEIPRCRLTAGKNKINRHLKCE